MNQDSLQKIIEQGETSTIEFKSWVKSGSMKNIINLVVPELIAFANCKGGTVFLGIEDDGTVTGCFGQYDLQNMCEIIYDRTRPSSITSSRADWVFGEVRLISSARNRFVKIQPGR